MVLGNSHFSWRHICLTVSMGCSAVLSHTPMKMFDLCHGKKKIVHQIIEDNYGRLETLNLDDRKRHK